MTETVDQILRQFKYQMFPFPIYLDVKVRVSTWFLLVLSYVLGTFFADFVHAKKIIEDKESGILVRRDLTISFLSLTTLFFVDFIWEFHQFHLKLGNFQTAWTGDERELVGRTSAGLYHSRGPVWDCDCVSTRQPDQCRLPPI